MAKITTTEIAKQAGVSQTTVSFVLNNRPGASISAETREKVWNVARALGYRPPAKGEKKHQITLGLMVPTLSNMYYPSLLQHIEIEAKRRNLNVLIMDILRDKANEAQYINSIKNGTVDGILALYMPYMNIPKDFPVVVVGECQPGSTTDTLSLNSHRAGYMAADHLVNLGHRHFAYISSPLSGITSARKIRLEGIFACLSEVGLENNLTVLTETDEHEINNSTYEYNCGYELTTKLLTQHRSVTAIIAVNDTTAAGCMAALSERGVNVPEEMSIMGFDNLLIDKMLHPQLTSVDQMATHACQVALDMLLAKIAAPWQDTLPVRMEYEPHLIVRGSTCPAPAHFDEGI